MLQTLNLSSCFLSIAPFPGWLEQLPKHFTPAQGGVFLCHFQALQQPSRRQHDRDITKHSHKCLTLPLSARPAPAIDGNVNRFQPHTEAEKPKQREQS
jgi:hypothetical protein